MKVFCVSGFSKSGKTTTVINLIKELKKRGYMVASMKGIHNKNFTMEKKGSDTWQHMNAGAVTVIARAENETYQIWNEKRTINQLLEGIKADWVIIEGMKSEIFPKIICAKNKEELDDLVDNTTFAISGIYSNNHYSYNTKKFGIIPVINSIDNIEEITNFVEKKIN